MFKEGGPMDFRSLQFFVTVAQKLNSTRAAEKLLMSQPPLSNQIRVPGGVSPGSL